MPNKATKQPNNIGKLTKHNVKTELHSEHPSSPWTKVNLKKALLKHYTQSPTYEIFQRFKLGAMLFFLGLVIIYGGYQLLEESLAQEIVVLLGVLLIGSGFLIAMLAQIRLLIGRLIHIFFH